MSRDEALAAVYGRLERADPGGELEAVREDGALDDGCALLAWEPEVFDDQEATVALGWLYWYRLTTVSREEIGGPLPQALAVAAAYLISPQYLQDRKVVPKEFAAFLKTVPGDLLESFGWQPAYTIPHAQVLAASGTRESLRVAAGMLYRSTHLTGIEHPVAPALFGQLGGVVRAHHELTGDLPEPLESCAGNEPVMLNDYAFALRQHAEDLGNEPAAADLGIEIARRAVAATEPGEAQRGAALSTLGLLLRMRGLLEEAVDALREASRTDDERAQRGGRLHNLAVVLVELHTATGRPGLLTEAVEAHRTALTLGDPALAAETHEHLAATAKLRYEREPSDEHLDAALAAARQAQDGGQVAELLLEVYAERGDVRAAQEALAHYRRALAESPRAERAEARLRLALALYSVSEGEDFPEALEESVALLRRNSRVRGLDPRLKTMNASLLEQIMNAEQGRPGEVEIIFNPAYLEPPARPDGQASAREESPAGETTRLRRLYERNGDLPTLAEAVEAGRRALDVSKGTPAWRGAATELAVALSLTYATTRNQAVFDESRDLFQAALDREAPDYPYISGELGILLQYARHTDPGLLDEANKRLQEAYAAAPEGSDGRWSVGSNLALCLMQRFESTRDLASLESAGKLIQQVAELVPAQAPQRAAVLTNGASILRLLAAETDQPPTAAAGIRLAQAAVDQAAPDDPRMPLYRLNLLLSLRDPYHNDEIPIGALWYRQELRKICALPDHPTVPMELRKSLLADALLMSLDLAAGRRGDLLPGLSPVTGARWAGEDDRVRDEREVESWRAEAFALLAAALERSAPGSPAENTARVRLGYAYLMHGDADRQEEGLRLLAAALRREGGLTPVERCHMARVWARAAGERGDWTGAAQAYRIAVDMLPRIVSRRLDQMDEERELGALHLLPIEAAEACALAGDAAGAVSVLEQGRGLLLARALDQRIDLDALAAVRPDLARRFGALAEALDGLTDPRRLLSPGDASPSERRHEIAALWDKLIAEIRQVPGFDRFLAPPRPSELLPGAPGEAVVYLNAGWRSAHAFLLTNGDVQAVALPGLSLDAGTDLANTCLRTEHVLQSPAATATEVYQAELALTDVLAELWDKLAAPVLEALGHTGRPEGVWPRVRWVPTGPFTFLPIHAASADGHAVLDRVVSSYLPTARISRPARAEAGGRALAVAVSGEPPLAAAVEEAALVADLMGGRLLSEGEATRAAVLELLGDYGLIHFACHALSDLDGLTGGRLMLAGEEPLAVADIARLNVPEGRMAFLSACGTAQGSTTILDQAIHICSAFQLAGYSDVIGTFWPVADGVAYVLTEDVYTRLSAGEIPALALHHAVRETRDRFPYSPWLWAAFAHFGP
ncbi:CHAT domain-containing protein [Nonomuraea sp. NPDC051941]|uniref:CHAT domain-containing protein n=1 Tax=Nonomuraea sp. NPDC051941 TaxID=3364373 RepID=UPI0037C78AF5